MITALEDVGRRPVQSVESHLDESLYHDEMAAFRLPPPRDANVGPPINPLHARLDQQFPDVPLDRMAAEACAASLASRGHVEWAAAVRQQGEQVHGAHRDALVPRQPQLRREMFDAEASSFLHLAKAAQAYLVRRDERGVASILVFDHVSLGCTMVPGGKAKDRNESTVFTVRREVEEEIGLQLPQERFHEIRTGILGEANLVRYHVDDYVVTLSWDESLSVVNREPDKHANMRWITELEFGELVSLTVPDLVDRAKNALQRAPRSPSGKPRSNPRDQLQEAWWLDEAGLVDNGIFGVAAPMDIEPEALPEPRQERAQSPELKRPRSDTLPDLVQALETYSNPVVAPPAPKPARPLRGIGSLDYERRLVESLDRVGSFNKPTILAKFNEITLDDVFEEEDLAESKPLVNNHEAIFIPSSSFLLPKKGVNDADGERIEWPWEQHDPQSVRDSRGRKRAVLHAVKDELIDRHFQYKTMVFDEAGLDVIGEYHGLVRVIRRCPPGKISQYKYPPLDSYICEYTFKGKRYSVVVGKDEIVEHLSVSTVTGSTRPVRSHHRLDEMINMGLDKASSDGKRGRTKTGVKAWFGFCEDVMGTQADRPMDPNETLWAKLEEEWLCMRFCAALREERGIAIDTIRCYFSQVQGWHAREHGVKLAGGLKLERLPQMLKGLKRVYGQAPRAVRRGIAPQALRKAFDLMLDPNNPAHANIRAALATALQGLLRSEEYTSTNKNFALTRDDVVQLNEQQMVIMMHPCKNMHHLAGKTCPLVIGAGGEHIDAVWEVQNMLRVDPTPSGDAANTPLFRNPSTNSPLSYQQILDTTRELMIAIGEDPSQFGTHSYRIGGASALFAAGANETVIRTMGRWSSDLHRLYVRACFEQCVDWTRKAGSTQVTDLAGTFDEVDFY
ncbi:MAG: hypothetical protein CBC48_05665 [bacterium TMED88]|nr:MAG: hypothetical protein CBC48_05665 [bacterium TMED88]